MIGLGKGGADHGSDHLPLTLVGMGKRVAHEVDPTALPCGTENLGGRCL